MRASSGPRGRHYRPMTADHPHTGYRQVLLTREYGGMFGAHLLSLLGDRIAAVAVSVLMYDRSGSVLLAALAYATSLLPWLIGAPFLAAFSDRWPRRRVMIVCDVLRAGLVAGFALPGLPLWSLLVLLTMVTCLGPPFEAARAATLPVVLDGEQAYVAGSALTMLSNQLSQVAGLAGGGLLLISLSTTGALLVDALTFLLSAGLLLVSLRPRPAVAAADSDGVWSRTIAGARLVGRDDRLRSLLLLAWVVAAVTVLPEGVAVAVARGLAAPHWAVGVLMAAVPAGAAVGAVVLGRLPDRVRARCVFPLAAVGVLALGCSAVGLPWPAVAGLWVLVGVGASVQLPVSTAFMRAVPDAYRARAFGLAQTGLMAGQGLALLGAGALADWLGVLPVLAAAAVTGGVWVLGLRILWPSQVGRPRTGGGAAEQQSPADRVPAPHLDRLAGGRRSTDPAGTVRRSRWSRVDAWIAFVCILGACAATAAALLLPVRPARTVVSPLLLAAAFVVTGSYVARLRVGRQLHVFQLDDIPRLIGLVFLGPAALVLSRLGGAAVALVVVRHQRGRKLLFNLASFALEVAVALAVFDALDPGHGVGPEVWPAALLATVVADWVSAITVGVVIGLSEGDLHLRRVLRPDRLAVATAIGAATVGMIAVTTLWSSPSSGLLIVLLVALGMAAQRGYATLISDNLTQERLQDLLGALAELEATQASMSGCLDKARELLAVEALLCRVAPAGGVTWHGAPEQAGDEPVTFLSRAPGGAPDLDLGSAEQLGRAQGKAVGQVGRSREPDPTAIALPVGGEVAEPGFLVAVEPLGGRTRFRAADEELLRTTAGMVASAVQRVAHRQRLLRDATHDRLTGLANLAAFSAHLAPRLERGEPLAVLTINLTRLRAVNDVFGREVGDQVIAAAADRVRRLAPPGSILARVGGHHLACAFAVRHGPAAAALARRLRSELERPLAAGDVHAEVGVHIGISLAPLHGRDPEVLLRRADAAADAAHDNPFGVAVFAPAGEQDAARPLRLVSDLRRVLDAADDQDELVVHYQPKLSLLTGTIVGHEALLRWQHPELGPIGPDEFVGLAESTGLIDPLTRFVLTRALSQSSRWHELHLPSSVAVNLSARNLLDDHLVAYVQQALAAAEVPPGRLTLELTETSVMAQPLRSVMVLDALAELGVTLSIDDFGTGYSNLTYLRQLPVQEVKLDRTFLLPVHDEPTLGQGGARALEFLRHAVALVHSLGLYVVVEGVEDQASLDALQSLDVDAAQGFHIRRPACAGEITDWMSARGSIGIV